MPADANKALHAKALGQFKFVAEHETDQRKSELEALKFEAGDQWTEDAKISRAGVPANASGTPAVPARPMLTMRTLDQPLAQLSSMARDADLGIKIVPKDGKAKKETAEVFQGLVRAIEVDSHSDDVYGWGFQRMRSCGRGYWRIDKALEKGTGGDTAKDQVLRLKQILNGFSVYIDPLRQFQDQGGEFEDPCGEFTFVTEDVPEAAYKRRFGTGKFNNASDSQVLTALGDDAKYWVIEAEDGSKSYRIAEYFHAVYDAHGRRSIRWGLMDGLGFLEGPQDWDGHYIPVIAVYGNEYNVGGKSMWEGLIQPAISPCRMLNYTVSSMAERMGTSNLAPWIVVAGQIEGYEAWWNQANVRNFPYLEYNAKTDATGQQPLPPPQRDTAEPDLSASVNMVGLFTNFIRSITGVPDAALGNVNPSDRSGKAIEALKQASDRGASNWLAFFAKGIRHTGVVTLDLIPPIYDRPGRVERIIGKDDEPQMVVLNQPFQRGPDGQPIPAPPQPGLMQRMGQAMGLASKPNGSPSMEHHILTEGQYGVICDVGKSVETRRQEAFLGMSALAQAAPEMVPQFADLWVRSMDIPDADAIADRIKPPNVDGPQQLPPEVQAQMQQMQAAMQELQKLADDNQTKLQIAQLSSETDLKKAEITSQTNVVVAQIKAGMDDLKNQMQILVKVMGIEAEAKAGAEVARRAELAEAHKHGHEVGKAQMDHELAKDLMDRQAERDREFAAQPPPIDPNALIQPPTPNGEA